MLFTVRILGASTYETRRANDTTFVTSVLYLKQLDPNQSFSCFERNSSYSGSVELIISTGVLTHFYQFGIDKHLS